MPDTKTAILPDLHVLLVDDDELFLKMAQAMLGALGVKHVTTATNGSDAFAKLAKTPRVVDVVLCDYSMDAGNGLQLLQSIRTGAIKLIRPDICFILLTASGDHSVVEAAAQLDTNGYLMKPVTPTSLQNAIVKARSRAVKVDFARYSSVVVPAH